MTCLSLGPGSTLGRSRGLPAELGDAGFPDSGNPSANISRVPATLLERMGTRSGGRRSGHCHSCRRGEGRCGGTCSARRAELGLGVSAGMEVAAQSRSGRGRRAGGLRCGDAVAARPARAGDVSSVVPSYRRAHRGAACTRADDGIDRPDRPRGVHARRRRCARRQRGDRCARRNAARPVLLFYAFDMPSAEIARALRIPDGTVRWRLAEGRRRLRSILSGTASNESVAR